jgi:pimeloyl-ACP methyl ester carboxylesterase
MVVFVHGAWVTSGCFDRFRGRFEERGHTCLAPPWPYDDRPIGDLRADPAPQLARQGVTEIVDHYERIVRELPEPPILVGHSFGGLFVQMLLDRGLGAAGVAVDPAPPRGVLAGPTAIRANFGVLRSWRGWSRTLTISYPAFRWAFVHTLPEADAREVYERYVIPTPGRIFFQAAFGAATKVRFRNPDRAPLLITAADQDRAVTAGMNRANVRKYRSSPAVTDFKEFPGRTHWLIAQPGWEEVADFAIEWAEGHAGESRSPARGNEHQPTTEGDATT